MIAKKGGIGRIRPDNPTPRTLRNLRKTPSKQKVAPRIPQPTVSRSAPKKKTPMPKGLGQKKR